VKKRFWRNELDAAEAAEADKLMERVRVLQNTAGQELSGVQILATFLRRRIQPLQARVHGMWMYQGATDPTRVGAEELSTNEVDKSIRSLTILTSDDECPGTPAVAPYGENNELPEVSLRFTFASMAVGSILMFNSYDNFFGCRATSTSCAIRHLVRNTWRTGARLPPARTFHP